MPMCERLSFDEELNCGKFEELRGFGVQEDVESRLLNQGIVRIVRVLENRVKSKEISCCE